MQIAFDFNPVLVNRYSGFYTFGVGLLGGFESLAAKPEFLLFHSKRFSESAYRQVEKLGEWAQLRPTAIKMRWLENFWNYSRYPRLEFFTGKFDLYHCFDHLMPPTNGRPRILTIHDLRRHVLADFYPKSKVGRFEMAVRRADHFIAVSQSAKDDLCNIFDIPQSKVDVIHLSANYEYEPLSEDKKQQFKTEYGRKSGVDLGRYLMAFSSPDSRKNIWRIIQAFNAAKKRLPDGMKLVVIGNLPKYDEKVNSGDMSFQQEGIILTGPVDNIADWLGCADGLVYTTLYEGFGIPILEAFSFGVPLITSNISSMPEVAGEAALLIDPYDEEAISKAIIELCTNAQTREKLIKMGFERRKDFSWQKTAEKTLEVYQKLL